MLQSRFFIIFSLFCITVFLSLGTWQLIRKREKEKFIADLFSVQTKSSKDADKIKELNFPCRFFAKGHFLPNTVVSLSAKTHQGKVGVYVLNVFKTEGGKFILVQRGWAKTPVLETPLEGVTIEGVARLPAPPTYFQPKNLPPTYFWIDLSLFSKELNLPLEPYYIVLKTPMDSRLLSTPPFPVPSNNHLQYAITWYSLAFTLMGMLLYERKRSLEKEST